MVSDFSFTYQKCSFWKWGKITFIHLLRKYIMFIQNSFSLTPMCSKCFLSFNFSVLLSPTYGKSCRSCQAWDPLCSWQEGEQQLITVTATVITIAIVIIIKIITTIANVITIDYNHQITLTKGLRNIMSCMKRSRSR